MTQFYSQFLVLVSPLMRFLGNAADEQRPAPGSAGEADADRNQLVNIRAALLDHNQIG